MENLEILTKAVRQLEKTNALLLRKLENKEEEKPNPEFMSTAELAERWRCKYPFINAQMKEGLRGYKATNKKMLFRISEVKEWEEKRFI